MKTATITQVNESKPLETQYGELFPHWIKLDNGDEGVANKKKPGALQVGQSLTYEVETKEGRNGPYNKIKEVKDKPFSANGRGGNASFALSYAKDVAVANIQMAGQPIPMGKLGSKVLALADEFYEWLEGKK